ncbi:MAG: hypothetical protein M3R24_14510 [Chloroflexota bacterium]|nr:hypothetical protein [Chloroflexota bacterium]PLS78237.1 MAG: hypothetical protein CYG59_19500 [Chloroflexota bacterium]
MTASAYHPKPTIGMAVTFKSESSQVLAGIPAHISYVWPRFRSGDYLVTLEYAEPVKFRNSLIRHIDAFVSELEQPKVGLNHQGGNATNSTTVESRPLVERALGAS